MRFERKITKKIKENLDNEEVLILTGARQTGKTTILRQLEKYLNNKDQTVFFLNLEDPQYLDLLNKHPESLFKIFDIDLKKHQYILIDEVQYLKNPTNFLKYIYDEYKENLKLIVSGSSAFYLDTKFKDSLAGRKKIFQIRTLSFSEFLLFKRQEDLLKEAEQKKYRNLSLDAYRSISSFYDEYVVYGGYPRVVLEENIEGKREILEELVFSYVKRDILEADVKDEISFYKLLKILASQVGNLVNTSELSNTLNVSTTMIDNYLNILEQSFHINLIRPFSKNIRSEMTKMPKVYFSDLGLRNFLIRDFKSISLREENSGAVLENAVYRQLLETNKLDDINYWRKDKRELDFIVKEKIVYEVKMRPRSFEKANLDLFEKQYEVSEFGVATFNAQEKKKTITDYEVYDVWEL